MPRRASLGLPTFNTVGLPDVAVKESRDRVKAAIKNSGFEFPAKRITVNLAPADIKKEGAAFDLPAAEESRAARVPSRRRPGGGHHGSSVARAAEKT